MTLPRHHSSLLSRVRIFESSRASASTREDLLDLLEHSLGMVKIFTWFNHPHAREVFEFSVELNRFPADKTIRWMSCSDEYFTMDESVQSESVGQ